jgi:hypothetical protein
LVTRFLRFLPLSPLLLAFLASPAFAENWIQPTAEELKMTSEPAAPDAAAIYLYREEKADDHLHMHSVYVRLKILTEKGKEEYGDVEIFNQGGFGIRAVEGRTIHSDGTIIPFTGKPYEKLLEKTKTVKYKAKVFTLPDVQVGSILEYRYVLSYDDNVVYFPEWFVQQPLYVRKAHYEFNPTDHLLTDKHGNSTRESLAWYPLLPAGVEVKYIPAERIYTVDIEKVPPMEEEEHMPPMRSVSYRVLFYYTNARNEDEYWKEEGKYWSKDIDKFMGEGKLGPIASQLVAASDTPKQKIQKIYDAVMKLENTSFTREHSGAEDKAEGLKIKTAADIWEAKRGNDDEIAILFVGLARAAGIPAYVAAVTDRDRAIFLRSYFSTSQLDDDIAIVVLDGKDQYLDPGERDCPFGDLHWRHTMAGGIRQTDHGTALIETPSVSYKATTILRNADVTLDADGKAHGTLRITLTGARALHWRQRALSTDVDEIKKEFEDSVQEQVPAGIQVKMNHFLGLGSYTSAFMAVLDVSGSMGTATSKRVFLPTMFFEAGSKPLFVHERRTAPIDLDYPYQMQDTVTIHLPKTMAVESAPKDAQIPLPENALYQAAFKQQPDTLVAGRLFVLGNVLYRVDEYGKLKDFYQKVNAKDQEQAVLHPVAAAAASGGAQ